MHHDIESVHASYSYSCSIFFVLTCSLPLVLFLFLFPILCYVLLVLNSSTMPRKTRVNRVPSTPSVSPSRVQLLGMSVRVRLMRNLIVSVRFGLSVL